MQFLESLEARHNEVLDELESLNGRIENVLESCMTRSEPGIDGES